MIKETPARGELELGVIFVVSYSIWKWLKGGSVRVAAALDSVD
jgi:hypothetical protein